MTHTNDAHRQRLYRVVEHRSHETNARLCCPQCRETRGEDRRVKQFFVIIPRSSTEYDDRIKKTDASKLQDEYAKLVEGLQEANSAEDAFVSNPGKLLFDCAHAG